MKRLLITAALVSFQLIAIGCGEKEADRFATEQKRNYILITLDTVRADHIGAWGYDEARTPNIDKLAGSGVVFENAVSTAPITMPSHSSIMTGLYPHNHGVRNNGAFQLDESNVTLAERFKDAGYDTAAVIAALVMDSKFGLDQGFRVYDDDLYSGKEQVMFMFKEINAQAVMDKTVALLDGKLKEPFFLWIHIFDAHANYEPPPPYDVLFLKQPYDGEIAFVDKQLGRLFDKLSSTGLADRTVTFLTSDHGDSLGDHGEMTHGIFIYRSTTHVPFIVAGPGIEHRGVNDIVSGVDIAPTIAQMAGLETMENIDGVSLASSILDGGDVPERDGVLMESMNPRLHFGWHELRAIETSDHKYIQAPKEEFYDLEKDPVEAHNLWPTQKNEASPLKKSLTAAFENDDPGNLKVKSVDAETQQMLEALGYMAQLDLHRNETLPDPKDMAGDWMVLQECQQLVRTKKFEAAEECLRKVLETNPRNWPASLSLAGVYRELGKQDDAEKVLLSANDLDPDNVKGLESIASLKIEQNKFDEAEKYLQDAAKSGKRDPEPWTLLGDMYQSLGKNSKALEAYSEALKCDDIYVKAYVGLANTFHQAGTSPKALEYLQEAIRIDPKNHAAWFNLGVVQDSLRKTEEAEKAYREAAQLNPDHAMTHNNLGSLLSRLGRRDEAKASFKRALAANPNHVESLYNMATMLLESEPDTAASMLTKALSINPTMVPARVNLAFAYQALGKPDQAMEQFQWIVANKEKAPGIYLSMARLEMDRGNKAAARGYLKKALAQDEKGAKAQAEADPVLKSLI